MLLKHGKGQVKWTENMMQEMTIAYNLTGFERVQDSLLDDKPQFLPAAIFVQQQVATDVCVVSARTHLQSSINQSIDYKKLPLIKVRPVSYTHLTLPTNREV